MAAIRKGHQHYIQSRIYRKYAQCSECSDQVMLSIQLVAFNVDPENTEPNPTIYLCGSCLLGYRVKLANGTR